MAKRRSDSEILADLLSRKEQLAEKEKDLRARIRKEERARDTRRKILLGSFVLQRLGAEPERFAEWLALIRGELPGFLRPEDLKLFSDILDLGPQDGEGEGGRRPGDRGHPEAAGRGAAALHLRGPGRRARRHTAAEVGPLLGDRRPETSWVVSANNGTSNRLCAGPDPSGAGDASGRDQRQGGAAGILQVRRLTGAGS